MQTRSGVGNSIKKAILFKVEANQVAEYREKLTQALAEFGVGLLISAIPSSVLMYHMQFRSHISVQDGVAQIDRRLEELVEAMKNFGLQSGFSPPSSRPPSANSMIIDSPPLASPSPQAASVEAVHVVHSPVPTPASPVPVAAAVTGATLGIVGTSAAYAVTPAVMAQFSPSANGAGNTTVIGSVFNQVGGNQTYNNFLEAGSVAGTVAANVSSGLMHVI